MDDERLAWLVVSILSDALTRIPVDTRSLVVARIEVPILGVEVLIGRCSPAGKLVHILALAGVRVRLLVLVLGLSVRAVVLVLVDGLTVSRVQREKTDGQRKEGSET